jgi:ArsR family transcriptional regulator
MVAAPKTDKVDLMFRAFSDRTRLRLLNMLRTGETCVCDLIAVLEVPQP